jgi:hypothetical protein
MLRKLPDGTVFDTVKNLVEAPLRDLPRMSATAGPTQPIHLKNQPSPSQGLPSGAFVPAQLDPMMQAAAQGVGYYGGQWDARARHGRNYAALGNGEPAEPSQMTKILAVAAIVGAAWLTVRLQSKKSKKGKGASKSKKGRRSKKSEEG